MIADTYTFGTLKPAAVSALSAEYVAVQVSASLDGVAVSPTALTVDFAVVAATVLPQSGDWHAAAWNTEAQAWSTVYEVTYLVSGFAVGEYDVWIKVVDTPNVVVSFLGRLSIR